MKKNHTRHTAGRGLGLMLALMLTVVSISGLLGGALLSRSGAAEAAPQTMPAQDPSPAIYVYQKNANSVVGILANRESWNRQYGQVETQTYAQGSGVVIREGGYILTNNHVVEDGETFQVLLPSGEKVDATLVGADSSTDLAVLKVSEGADQLIPVEMGDTSSLVVGSTVIAIGNPGGEELANTVTQGIVSALERTSISGKNEARSIKFIQHDAAISSGNSGGGLFNYMGQLVGINARKIGNGASLYSSSSYEGLGFAIPAETVKTVSDQLIENGKVLRPGLNVTVQNYEDGPDEPMQNQPPKSVVIMSVLEGGAAEKAGLEQYDFIYEVDGQRITSMQDLTGILDQHEAGDTVSVTVVRYQQKGIQQVADNTYGMNPFGYFFGYGNGYGNGYGSNGYGYDSQSGELVAGGGYEMVTVDVTLQVVE